MKVVLFAPDVDGTDVSETYSAFKWAQMLSRRVDLTVLAFQRPGRTSVALQLPDAKVVTWPEPAFLLRTPRFNAMLKPAYGLLYRQVRRWLRAELAQGRRFDLAHQVMPQAARYPCVFTGLGIPYIFGPFGGSLTTPQHFRSEVGSAPWFTHLRALDRWRLRHDPWLRRSIAEADLVLGVAPYVETLLRPVPLRRFAVELQIGIEDLDPPRIASTRTGLRLLHVGRAVRTKGLRDVVRAMALLRDLPDLTLVSAGGGEDLAACRAEALSLGVADRISFRGELDRAAVRRAYADADVLVFPSFREPAGAVVFEAMRAALPVITVDIGRPGAMVDAGCGLRQREGAVLVW